MTASLTTYNMGSNQASIKKDKPLKVLLYGEYSGVHNNLKQGLEALGVKVDLLTTGDGFKSFEGNLPALPRHGNAISKFKADIVNSKNLFRTQSKYDVIQFINPRPGILTPRFGIDSKLVNHFMQFCNKSFYYACGCDTKTRRTVLINSEILGGFCKGCIKDNQTTECPIIKNAYILEDKYFLEKIDGIIAGGNGLYSQTYNNEDKYLGYINFSIDLEKFKISENINKEKIILHGINRYHNKGSDLIIEALKNLSNQNINYEIVSKLPIKQYIERLKSCEILIDQLYSDILGMNTLQGLAAGMVVITSYDKKLLSNAPVLNIANCRGNELADVIYQGYSMSKNEKKKFRSISLEYLIEYHNPLKIAEKFLNFWALN